MVTRKGLGQANILRTNNNTSTGYGVAYADEVSGHRTVGNLTALYTLHDWQLSASGNNTDNDAIGQLWYVVNADGNGNGCYYQLKGWSKRKEAAGWSEFKGTGASTAAAITFDNAASGMTAVNAQGAIEELNVKKLAKADIAQEPGNSEELVMSQKAVSDKLKGLSTEIIYDVSARNNGVVFESLSALLSSSDLNTLIPMLVRHGGMSIRFVQSSDNKYVQYRLIANTFSTTVTDWQGVDDKPTTGSNNLVKSGGVAEMISANKTETDTKLTELGSKTRGISNKDVTSNEQEIVFAKDNGEEVGVINDEGADFIHIKSGGKDVVTKEYGKDLSSNDYTDNDKELVQSLSYNISSKESHVADESVAFENKDGETVFEITNKSAFVKGVDILETLNKYDNKFYGVIRHRGSSDYAYQNRIGDFNEIASHFRMAMVKDGNVMYFLDQTDITKKEDGTEANLDGTDGDMLIVNDVPIYYVNVGNSVYDMKLFSLKAFSYDGVQADVIRPRGFSAGLAYVENINGNDVNDYINLGNGKSHYCRNANYIGDFAEMQGLVGKYVPTQNDNSITYNYDANGKYASSGAMRPKMAFTQRVAEKSAMNKNVNDAVYTNIDLLTVELILSMVQCEVGTKDISSYSLFGAPYSRNPIPPSYVFENGRDSFCGVRFKNNNGEWVYARIDDKPFDNGLTMAQMLISYFSPWEIMEQHLALSYAKANNISMNSWYVYNGNEYKWVSKPSFKSLDDGVMSAVLFKRFKSKLGDITYNGESVQGNDIEYVINSAIYRGIILDSSFHTWLTGINCILDGNEPNAYYMWVEKDYKKYIMDKDYEPISSGSLYDFEHLYKLAGIVKGESAVLYGKDCSDVSLIVPSVAVEVTEYKKDYEKIRFETDSVVANGSHYEEQDQYPVAETNVKMITGVKHGYYHSVPCQYSYIYLNHKRHYHRAMAGGMSFVCQNVNV